jgi:glycosyltransferase involved in cell wall biosynthesis
MNLAFCKFAGMANGGTEKYLQTLALLYKVHGHNIDYYYTNAAKILDHNWVHPDNDAIRIELMKSNGINLIPIHVESRYKNHWNGSDFFDKFKNKYDYLITAGNGEAEFPYTEIQNIPIIHTVHGFHAYNQDNIIKSVMICQWQADIWIKNGGNSNRCEIIPPIVQVPSDHDLNEMIDLRDQLDIPSDALVFGIHQREGVGNNIALEAFCRAQIDNSFYIVLGGSKINRDNYKKDNILFLNHTSDTTMIHRFLRTLDVYAHCRTDGEVCSACIIEAMYHGLPIISHVGFGPNYGHLEQLECCGHVTNDVNDYTSVMSKMVDHEYRDSLSEKVSAKYRYEYDYDSVVSKYLALLK